MCDYFLYDYEDHYHYFFFCELPLHALRKILTLCDFFNSVSTIGASCLPLLSLMVLEETLQILEMFKAGE